MKKRFFFAVLDILMLFFASLIAIWFLAPSRIGISIIRMAVQSAAYVAALLVVGFYKVRIDNSSLGLIHRAINGLFPITLLYFIVTGFKYGFRAIQTKYVILYSIFAFLTICGSRAIIRLLTEGKENTGKPKVVIYGAGELGTTMARFCKRGKFGYDIAGFIDDDRSLSGEIIVDYPILGTLDNLDSILDNDRIETVVIAIADIKAEKLHKVVEVARKHGVDTKIVPNIYESQTNHAEPVLRDINLEDLLGRNLITIEKEPLFDMFGNKTVLVTGAGGSIGSEICKQLMEFGLEKLILLDIDETELHDVSLRLLEYEKEWSEKVVPVVCDIKNGAKLQRIFAKYKPQIVFHAAAYKHVPLMELYPEEAITTNICGSYNVFKAAADNNAERTIVISTDKAVNPTNIMGATKRVVEKMSATFNKETGTDFCCVRFGNVIGSRGSMLPLFLEEIKAGKPITVTDRKVIRYFMAIPEAVSLVFRAATLANGGEVMVLDMGEPVNIYDFAQKLIQMYGNEHSKIVVTGLRPGEKLYEELLATKDNTIPTVNERIFKAKVNIDDQYSMQYISQMVERIPVEEPEALVQHLHQDVPEFTGKNR